MLKNISRRKFAFIERIKLTLKYFCGAVVIFSLSNGIAVKFWYPDHYLFLTGTDKLLWLMASVSLIVGPLLILIVSNLDKPKTALRRDVAVLSTLQFLALGYGIYALYQGRPVAVVFEVDRFRVVSAADVLMEELPEALPPFRALSLSGPKTLSVRRSANADEKFEAVNLALQGFDLGQRPKYWQPIYNARRQVLERSRPVSELLAHYSMSRFDIQDRLIELKVQSQTARFLPVSARTTNWTAVVGEDSQLVGFVPYDGFF